MKPLAYLNSFADRYGVRRYFFRRYGKRTPLPGKPGEPEFQRAYAKALSLSLKGPIAGTEPKDRSMAALVRAYRSSPKFIACKASTQKAYNQALWEIEELWGKYPVAGLTPQKLDELMKNRAHDPKRANRLHKRLRAIMDLAVRYGWIQSNPVSKDRPYKVKVDGFRAWPESQIDLFHARWPRGTPERVAFDLLLYLGQRSIDTVAMARNHISGGRIRVKQEKTGTPLDIRLHRELSATLDAGPVGGLYLIETQYGRPRAVKGFYNWFKSAAGKAGCDANLSPHGLRKAAATRLADAGATTAQICAITGHRSIQEMERYIRGRDQVRLADAAVVLLETERNKT